MDIVKLSRSLSGARFFLVSGYSNLYMWHGSRWYQVHFGEIPGKAAMLLIMNEVDYVYITNARVVELVIKS